MTQNDLPPPAAVPAKQGPMKTSLTTALVLGFGAVILVGMFLVQGISMWSAQKNTRELLGANAQFAVLSMVRETRRRLAPVSGLNEYITHMIDAEQVDVDDHELFGETLLTAMAGTNQVFGMALYIPMDHRSASGVGAACCPPNHRTKTLLTTVRSLKPDQNTSLIGARRSGSRRSSLQSFQFAHPSGKANAFAAY